jgi:hypothetical protein
MTARIRSSVAALLAVLLVRAALAQDQLPELTPAGQAILKDVLAFDSRQLPGRAGATKPKAFPLAMCAFPGGLCGAVNRDGTVAVPPRYDWVGTFSDGRAAVRVGGLYGFVDEHGREIIKPQHRVVGDYKFGFAKVDVDGKSGLKDRDGKMAITPKYGFIEAIGPDRFQVTDERRLGGMQGGEDFSPIRYTPSGGIVLELHANGASRGVIDISGQLIELPTQVFNKEDASLRWIQSDKLWGLARADGTWLVEPKFEQADALSDGLARVKVNRKVGFIDRRGNFAIEPVFDDAWRFERGLGRTAASRDAILGVIDNTGAWLFQTSYQQVHPAIAHGRDRDSKTVVGWQFRKTDRWGLLDQDGRVVLDAEFDDPIQFCDDGRLSTYKDKAPLYFKRDGSPLQPPNGRIVNGSCGSSPPYTLRIGDKYGLVDADTAPFTPVHFDAVDWTGPRGSALNVKIDGKWGRIGLDGRWLLEPRFDYLSSGIDLFVAAVDGKRGFMRSDGSWLIEPKFDAARLRDAETAFATVSGATGVLRLKDQSWAVAPRPGVMCEITNAIMAQADGRRVILSPEGEIWIDINAERIGLRLEIGLLTFLKSRKWGLVDTSGQVMVEPQYDDPVYFMEGLRGIAWTKRGDRWCAIDRRGRLVPSIPCTNADPIHLPHGPVVCKVEL